MAKIQNPDSNREREIYSRAALADFSAVGELVFTRLHPYFCGIVKKYRASASDCYIEEVMHAFLEHIATPTSEGLYRLRSLNPDASPKTYMGRMFNNFFIDYLARQSELPVSVEEIRGAGDNDSDDENDTITAGHTSAYRENATHDLSQRRRRENAQIWALVKALEHALENFGAEERYILLTYLLSERFANTGRPLKLSTRLGLQLDKKAEAVYGIYDRRLRKLQKVASEIYKATIADDECEKFDN